MASWRDQSEEVTVTKDWRSQSEEIPAQQTSQVYDERYGKTYELPSSYTAEQAGYAIDTKSENQSPGNFLFKIPVVNKVLRGLDLGIAETAPAIGGLYAQRLELKAQETEQQLSAGKKDYLFGMVQTDISPEERVRLQERVDYNKRVAKKILDYNDTFIKRYENKWDERGVEGGFVSDLAKGASSLGTTIALTLISKSTAPAAAWAAAIQDSQIYQEARKSGKEPQEAFKIATAAGGLEGTLESFGLGKFFDAFKSASPMKAFVKSFATEFLQEASQTAAEQGITNVSGVRETDLSDALFEIAYSGLIGGLVGGPVGVAGFRMEQQESVSRLIDAGLTKDQAIKLEEKVRTTDYSQVVEYLLNNEIDTMKTEKPFQSEQEALDIITRAIQGHKIVINEDGTHRVIPPVVEEVQSREDVQQEVVNRYGELDIEEMESSLRDSGYYYDVVSGAVLTADENGSITIDYVNDKGEKVTEQTTYASAVERLNTARQDSVVQLKQTETALRTAPSSVNVLIDMARTSDTREDFLNKLSSRKSLSADAMNWLSDNYGDRVEDFVDDVKNQEKLMTIDNTPYKDMVVSAREQNDYQTLMDDKQKVSSKTDSQKSFMKDMGDTLLPITTKLRRIAPRYEAMLRKFQFDLSRQQHKDGIVIGEFIRKFKDLNEATQKITGLNLANGRFDLVEAALKKVGMSDEFVKLKKALADIYKRAQDAGFTFEARDNYFPRMIKDVKGFIREISKTEEGLAFIEEMESKAAESGKTLSDDEKATIIDEFLFQNKDFGKFSKRTSRNFKQRYMETLSASAYKYLYPVDEALSKYFRVVNDAIEMRKMLGGKDDNIINTGKATDTIASFVKNEILKGNITPEQGIELADTLVKRFNVKGMSKWLATIKNGLTPLYLASPLSAIKNVSDTMIAVKVGGLLNTFNGIGRVIAGRQRVTLEDLGIDNVINEFFDKGGLQETTKAIMSASSFTAFDRFGKITLIESSLSKYQAEARKSKSKLLDKELSDIFGERANKVRQDLKDGRITDDVRFLLFSTLSDWQVTSLSEMSPKFISGGNMRIAYMFKSYMLRRLDALNRETLENINNGIQKISEGDKAAGRALVRKGVFNSLWLVALITLGEASTDELINIMLGRESKFSDTVLNGLYKVVGFNKFGVSKLSSAPAQAITEQFFSIPVKAIDDIKKDTEKAIKDGGLDPEDSKSIQYLPVVGKLYYFWFGVGERNKDKRD